MVLIKYYFLKVYSLDLNRFICITGIVWSCFTYSQGVIINDECKYNYDSLEECNTCNDYGICYCFTYDDVFF